MTRSKVNQNRSQSGETTLRSVGRPELLNLGCGKRFHPEWTNVDVVAAGPGVIELDLLRPLPFRESTFDAVYHSHVIEHLPPENVRTFLLECRRLLKPGGTLRVVAPDLEQIASLYLKALHEAEAGSVEAEHHYDWLMLEMYDQVVRTSSGGAMAAYLRKKDLPDREFVLRRLGAEARAFMDNDTAEPRVARESYMKRAASRLAHVLREPRVSLARLLLGRDFALYQLGRFRVSGEIHQWMYDRFSLARLMRETGFESARVMASGHSSIAGWETYELDASPADGVHKPDSIFMEARKPS